MANAKATEVFFVVVGKGLSEPSGFVYSQNPMDSAQKRTIVSAVLKSFPISQSVCLSLFHKSEKVDCVSITMIHRI